MTTKFQTLSIVDSKAWILATLFVAGNVILPQVCHLVPNGGLMLLPIYFFTLVAAYKYGWQVGIITAIASPLINSMLFGMPASAMLPIIIIKGALLAVAAGMAAKYFQRANLLIIAAVVIAYQLVGGAIESIMAGNVMAGLQDITIGLPGILLQIFGGYLVIKNL